MYYDMPLFHYAYAGQRRLIEHNGRHLGMIVERPHGYVVYACAHLVWPLDGRVFPTWEAAEREIVVSTAL